VRVAARALHAAFLPTYEGYVPLSVHRPPVAPVTYELREVPLVVCRSTYMGATAALQGLCLVLSQYGVHVLAYSLQLNLGSSVEGIHACFHGFIAQPQGAAVLPFSSVNVLQRQVLQLLHVRPSWQAVVALELVEVLDSAVGSAYVSRSWSAYVLRSCLPPPHAIHTRVHVPLHPLTPACALRSPLTHLS
jgi:hypothetical protein